MPNSEQTLRRLREHNEKLSKRIDALISLGAQILWRDDRGQRPDVIYIRDGVVYGEDIKTTKADETDFAIPVSLELPLVEPAAIPIVRCKMCRRLAIDGTRDHHVGSP